MLIQKKEERGKGWVGQGHMRLDDALFYIYIRELHDDALGKSLVMNS